MLVLPTLEPLPHVVGASGEALDSVGGVRRAEGRAHRKQRTFLVRGQTSGRLPGGGLFCRGPC